MQVNISVRSLAVLALTLVLHVEFTINYFYGELRTGDVLIYLDLIKQFCQYIF